MAAVAVVTPIRMEAEAGGEGEEVPVMGVSTMLGPSHASVVAGKEAASPEVAKGGELSPSKEITEATHAEQSGEGGEGGESGGDGGSGKGEAGGVGGADAVEATGLGVVVVAASAEAANVEGETKAGETKAEDTGNAGSAAAAVAVAATESAAAVPVVPVVPVVAAVALAVKPPETCVDALLDYITAEDGDMSVDRAHVAVCSLPYTWSKFNLKVAELAMAIVNRFLALRRDTKRGWSFMPLSPGQTRLLNVVALMAGHVCLRAVVQVRVWT